MEQVLFESNLIKIGIFTLPTHDKAFNQPGLIKNPHLVFPKNSIWIKHENKPAFIADTSMVNSYNEHQYYERACIHPEGDFCHWIELLPNFIGCQKKVFAHDYVQCDLNWYVLHLKLLKSLSKSHLPDSLEVEERVATLFSEILLRDSNSVEINTKVSTKQQRNLVSRVKHCINQDLSTNLSLAEIANQSFSSPFHVSRMFKKITGVRINHYRNHQRLRIISLKLQQDCSDLATLAYEFGYSSHSHLSYCFKKYFGHSPSEFKKLLIKQYFDNR